MPMNNQMIDTNKEMRITNIKLVHRKIKEKNSKNFDDKFLNDIDDLCFENVIKDKYIISILNCGNN
jgi:hypothetical protein